MSPDVRLDDRVSQDGWTIQPTHHEGEYRLSHDAIHVTFHGARLEESDGIARFRLRRHSDSGTVEAATVTRSNVPWRIRTWLGELVAETSGVDR